MAIHPEYPGLCAEVVVNDAALKEYDDEEEGGEDQPSETVSKFAQVDSDAHFGIRYTIPTNLTGECGVRSQLWLDGKKMCSWVHARREFGQVDVTKCLDKFHTTIDGRNYEQRFRFAQLQIDEDVKREEHTPQQLKSIGTVTLKLSFINNITKRNRTPGPRETPGAVHEDKLPVLGEVTEKSMKGDAKSHQASLDVPIFTGRYKPSRSKTRTIRDCGRPFAIFHFKYRSLAALKSLHIADRMLISSPIPPNQRAVEDMTREELEAIARNSQVKAEPGARAMKMEGASNLKREAGAVDADDEIEFVSSKRKKAVPSQDDEVIVLD